MSREVQHIAERGAIDDCKKGGRKVKAMCGARIYPMTEMDESIPTCTPCNRKVLAELNQYRAPSLYTYRFTASTWGTGTTSGGAA